MSSMGIGSKPCLDIRPSQNQISDRSISISQLGNTFGMIVYQGKEINIKLYFQHPNSGTHSWARCPRNRRRRRRDPIRLSQSIRCPQARAARRARAVMAVRIGTQTPRLRMRKIRTRTATPIIIIAIIIMMAVSSPPKRWRPIRRRARAERAITITTITDPRR